MKAGDQVRLTRYPDHIGRIDYLLTANNKVPFGLGLDQRIITFAELDREFDLEPCERAAVNWFEGSPIMSIIRIDRIEEVPLEQNA